MAKNSPDHVHRYTLKKLGNKGYEVYACNKPTCPHYIPLALAEGKLTECNRCFNLMIISKHTLYGSRGKAMVKPHCAECTKTRKVVPDFTGLLAEKDVK
jgi:hypothetical protein